MEQVEGRSEPQEASQEVAAPSPVGPTGAIGGNGSEPPTGPAEPDGRTDGDVLPPDGRPPSRLSTAVPAIAVVAIVAVVGLTGWLIGRGDDLGDVGQGSPVETQPAVGPGVTVEPSVLETADPAIETPATETPASASPETASPETDPPAIVPPETAATVAPDTDPPPTQAATVPLTPLPTPVVSVPAGGPTPSDPVAEPDDDPADDPVDAITDVVPNLAAFPDYITDPAALATLVSELLASGRHDVASPTPVSTLCAAVPLDGPLELSGRWELDGRPLSSSDLAELGPPGFGDCIDDDGDALQDGAYQFIVVDDAGAESAAGTFVAGAERIDQRFRNNGEDAVCSILIGPSSSDYYEAFVFRGPPPIRPGDDVTIPVADVRQDVRAIGCAEGRTLAKFSFDPSAGEAQELIS